MFTFSFVLRIIKPWLKLPTGCQGHVICMGNLGGVFFSRKAVHFFHINKLVREMVIMNDLEWPMLSYYVILYETFRTVIQGTEKVALIMKGEGLVCPSVQRIMLLKSTSVKICHGIILIYHTVLIKTNGHKDQKKTFMSEQTHSFNIYSKINTCSFNKK